MGLEAAYEAAEQSLGTRLKHSARLGWLAIRLVWRASPKLFIGIVGFLALEAALAPLVLLLSRVVIDDVARPGGTDTSVWVWIALLGGALALSQLIQPFRDTIRALAGDRMTGYITGELIRATNRWRGLARFEDPALADDLQRSRERTPRSGLDLVTFGGQAILANLTTLGLIAVLVGLHPIVPVMIFAANIPQMAKQWEFGNRTVSHIYVQTAQSRQLEYARAAMVDVDLAKDVRLLELGPFFRRRYDEFYASAVGELNQLRWRLTGPMTGAAALAVLVTGAALVYVVWSVADGRASIGELVLFAGAIIMLENNLRMIGSQLGYVPYGFGFLPGLFRVLEATPDLAEPANPRPAPRPIREGIVVENVSFTYPGTSEPALRNVDLVLRPGESLAMVGHNGSGKTTLVKLLLRLYDPTEGRILLDGHDLRGYDLTDLRRELGVIFQDFVRYDFTAGENVGLGRVDRIDDRELIAAAARRSGADEVLDQLPDGMDTAVGREFGGRELSGGEWQKLALARAFARDCQLLVLDEPTASLDPPTEYTIYQRFAELTRDRMTVLVSHRFSTTRMADRVVLLDGGRVREEGTHADLLAANGEYARLYRTQAELYLDDGELT